MTDHGKDEHIMNGGDFARPKDRFRVIENEDEPLPSQISPNQLHLIETIEAAPEVLDDSMVALPIDPNMVELRAQWALLRQEHQDLSDSIDALMIVAVPDQILIARLKRKKLILKDRITELEDRIRPDIIA
jgi:hypothetical protein